MNRKTLLGGAGYESPVCTQLEVSVEGILCESFGNESFGVGDDGAKTYGSGIDGIENNGWY